MAGSIDQEIALGAVDDAQSLPILGKLHEWVVTVDHKRLGIMYIGGGLFFLVVAGLQALTIRLPLAVPDAGIVPPQVPQSPAPRCTAPRWSSWSGCQSSPGTRTISCR